MTKKPFKETKVGQFLQSKGFNSVLHMVGNAIPLVGTLIDVKDLVLGTNGAVPEVQLSPEDKAQFLELYNAEINELDLRLKDVADARSREVEIVKAGDKNHTQNILAFVGVAGLLSVVFYILIFGIANMPKEMVLMMGSLIGVLASKYGSIYDYYFGSSSGAKRNGDSLRKIAEG